MYVEEKVDSVVELEQLILDGTQSDEEGDIAEDELIPQELLDSGPKDAGALNTKQLARELEIRNVKPSGFWGDDSKRLQIIYSKEYDELVEKHKRQQDRLARKRAKELKIAEAKDRQLRAKLEEQSALREAPQVDFWFELMKQNLCPSDAIFQNFNSPLCRILSRNISYTNRLHTLDLSHSSLKDESGSMFLKAVASNTSLKRLELENTKIGVKSARSLELVFTNNQSLVHLNLENNPLTCNHTDYVGIHSIANGLAKNSTLVFLNMWRTELGKPGGKILAEGLKANTTIISLGTGNNAIQLSDERSIHRTLERNKDILEREEAIRREKLLKQREIDRIRKEKEDIERKKIEEQEWLLSQKEKRAEARRKRKEEEERQRLEKIRLEKEEQERKEAEERRIAELKKRKKKKKKKKK